MTKATINIRAELRRKIGNSTTSVPCSIDLEETLNFNELDTIEVDIHDLLAEQRLVVVIWGTEDVLSIRPDLTDDQAWEVLQECRRLHDCELGFNWLLIETVAEDIFPASTEGDAE